MSLPSFPDRGNLPSREEVINQILSSIAMEELGLSHIINAEGEKLQYALGTIPGMPGPQEPLTVEDLLELNKSIHTTLNSTMMNHYFLKESLVQALTAGVMQGPTGPTGPQGPASIAVIEQADSLPHDMPPYVRNEGTTLDNLLRFGIPKGEPGPVGTILASYESYAAFIAEHPTGEQGDSYLVAGTLYVWNAAAAQWESMGDLQGPQGTGTTIKGTAGSKEQLDRDYPTGPPEDAYLIDGAIYIWNAEEMWHSAGSLRGPAGPQGLEGAAGAQGGEGPAGRQGIKGEAGQSGTVMGVYESEAALRAAHPTGVASEFYLVGSAATGYTLWVWDELNVEWLNAGVFNALDGPAGPEGPRGEEGPPGSFSVGQELFTIKNQVGSEQLGYQGEIAFKSDTLSVSVEPGPAVRIERPYSLGALAFFSSGSVQTFTTDALGKRSRIAIVSQGSNQHLVSGEDPVNMSTQPELAFPMPAPATINAFSFFFSLNSNTTLLWQHSTKMTAAIYRSVNPLSNEFTAIPETAITIDIPFNAPVGTTYSMVKENLDVKLGAAERLMMVVTTETAPEYALTSTIGGYMSGAIRFL